MHGCNFTLAGSRSWGEPPFSARAFTFRMGNVKAFVETAISFICNILLVGTIFYLYMYLSIYLLPIYHLSISIYWQ